MQRYTDSGNVNMVDICGVVELSFHFNVQHGYKLDDYSRNIVIEEFDCLSNPIREILSTVVVLKKSVGASKMP